MPKGKWTEVEDKNVRHVWGCFDKDCEEGNPTVNVAPTSYQDSGVPMCSCESEDEMCYIRTEIKK
jgi:hypothetical protein